MAKTAVVTSPECGAQFPPPDALPLDGFSRWHDLRSFVPFSRETLRKREMEGRFPRRHRLSQRCAAWPNREIHRWFADPVNYRVEDK
ncbi:AlpA family phage regulatory protein [Paraburkholderia panacisoli]|uniref:AlpA family phage regulatory protein n=1 Tax=Paraburkholderia panacisoli TaxID=2603818 RepID=A0A5B0HJI5_9BURK|nr:AlpA family phage regulatory protein [Paraburkholderia panacisoli]KAA1015124.1 AlpA family phage regulatory protein [Paraburkholderia panacisoli]